MVSIKVLYHKHRVKDGIALLYIRIGIDGFYKYLPLDIKWPQKFFDLESGQCLQRDKNDRDASDNNIIIRNEISKVNEIVKYYRLADIPININRFMSDYQNNISKSNFIEYMENKLLQRKKDGEIEYITLKRHYCTLRKLKQFNKHLLFSDFNETWGNKFDAWMKKHVKSVLKTQSQNTRWSHHKIVKTYMNLAKRDNIKFIYPYDFFTISPTKGNWLAIYEDDINTLWKHYKSMDECGVRYILRAFLFACFTGLRVSDLKSVKNDWVADGMLIFLPHKTKKQNRILKIPLSDTAKELLADARINENLFGLHTEQYGNRTLKEIAAELGIKTNLHWHVARHTFITLYYAKTKDLIAAKEFAGHADLRQTIKYTHQNPDEIKEKMKVMNDIIKN